MEQTLEPSRGGPAASREPMVFSVIPFLHLSGEDRVGVLASCSCHNERPQPWWLKATHIHPVTVLQVRSWALIG